MISKISGKLGTSLIKASCTMNNSQLNSTPKYDFGIAKNAMLGSAANKKHLIKVGSFTF